MAVVTEVVTEVVVAEVVLTKVDKTCADVVSCGTDVWFWVASVE